VGGVTSKIEAAIEAGIQKVLIPAANLKDVLLDDDKKGLIEVIPVDTISDVLEHALVWKEKKDVLNKIKRLARHTTDVVSGPVPTA
jgi:Lon-like ATP-dependent protease